ncbi:MAG: hypothetical protein KBC96_06105 [Armatimonadetes bacterium]|nr:hypothetical protein [Armatimonadota bacterium]
MFKSAKVFLIAIAAVSICLPASAAIQNVCAPSPGPINGGWNLMSLPAIPTNPTPAAVLDEYGSSLEGNIYRWDAALQNLVAYSEWTPEAFGNMLITEGYWLALPAGAPAQLCFEGITDNDTTDMWISLPKTGWTIIGCPYSYQVDWNAVEITDGTVTLPLAAARGSAWLETIAYWWDSGTQNLKQMGLDDDWGDTTTLDPWHGYWVESKKDNLALIVPAAS